MNDYTTLAVIGWFIAIPLLIAAWLSPRVLLWAKRRLVARADALTAARAAYRVAYDAAMGIPNEGLEWEARR